MPYVSTPDEDASSDVAHLYATDRFHLGYVPTYTKVFAHRPAVLAAWTALSSAIRASMEPVRYELATLAAASALRSDYCALAYGKVLAEERLGPGAVLGLMAGDHPADHDPVAVAVMALAEKVAGGAADMTEDDLVPLRDLGLDDADILDVVLAAAARCFFSSVLSAVGAEPDAALTQLDPVLVAALTGGRRAV